MNHAATITEGAGVRRRIRNGMDLWMPTQRVLSLQVFELCSGAGAQTLPHVPLAHTAARHR